MKITTRLLVGLLIALNLAATKPVGMAAGETRVYFGETGHWLGGVFWRYWQEHGGLAQFGYPLTPEFYEGDYLVQYFERNRLEYHPENAGSPYEVLLGHLGRERLAADKPVVGPAAEPKAGALTFRETGYSLGGLFRQYWQTHGGLAQFGFPLGEEIEVNGLTVQYFERARFERHPEYAGSPYEVLLTRLGVEEAGKLDPDLRDGWSGSPVKVNLSITRAGQTVSALANLSVTSDQPGELRLLGGDNREYARYSLTANQPTTLTVAGAPGPQSWLFYQNGQIVAAQWRGWTLTRLDNRISSGDPVLDKLYPRVKGYLEQDRVTYDSPLDGQPVTGYRSPDTPFIWLRDHVYQSKGFKYFEPQMKATLDYFRASQHPDGSFDDYFEYFKGYDIYKGQIEVEADREYLFIQGVWTAWQATGDDDWLRTNLAAMERGLEYTFTSPQRWSAELGLVKRAFTIDTWDFEQGSDRGQVRRNLDAKTRWGIFHGDNTGAYESARRLAQVERYLGRGDQAAKWESRAAQLQQNLNKVAWNGQFFTHQVHLTPVDPTGVDEKSQLSLSNAYALNREILSQEQAAAIIRTYQNRAAQNAGKSFAEWYSIDPPFPQGFGPVGEYVNGGIMPLVGGELARGAFEHGFESYGLDILRRYWQLLDQAGGSYLWYHPDGRPGLGTTATLPTDGWGSAAMLSALTEGLAGVVDMDKLYQQVDLSPRWAITDRPAAEVSLSYGASGAYFSYHWQRDEGAKTLRLTWGGAQTHAVHLHLLWPANWPAPQQLTVNGQPAPFTLSTVESSRYLDAELGGSEQLEVKSQDQ